MDKQQKEEIIQQARKVAERLALFFNYEIERCCLFHAWAFLQACRKRNIPCLFQAGTANFQRLTDEQDAAEGRKGFTHFSYSWEDNSPAMVLAYLQMGRMPELHAWNALPAYNGEPDQIVDITTGYQEIQCKKLGGMDWPGPKLPDYVWFDEATHPEGVHYVPCPLAITIATRVLLALLRKVHKEKIA